MIAAGRPTISGVIPTHDRPAFLREAIESALAQTLPLDELIVVDDGSPEDPAALIATFGDRVRLLRQPVQAGGSAARNAGVAAARGDIVAFLDDDDHWLPDKLARQVPTLTADCEAALCGWRYLGEAKSQVRPITTVTEDDLRRGNLYCGTSGLIARRSVLHDEPFDETLPRGQDWDLFIRLARRRPLAYVAEPLYLYRRGPHHGITRSGYDSTPAELLHRAEVIRKHRHWLGEWKYNTLIARGLLLNISKRPNKRKYLMFAIKQAGLLASMNALLKKSLPR